MQQFGEMQVSQFNLSKPFSLTYLLFTERPCDSLHVKRLEHDVEGQDWPEPQEHGGCGALERAGRHHHTLDVGNIKEMPTSIR